MTGWLRQRWRPLALHGLLLALSVVLLRQGGLLNGWLGVSFHYLLPPLVLGLLLLLAADLSSLLTLPEAQRFLRLPLEPAAPRRRQYTLWAAMLRRAARGLAVVAWLPAGLALAPQLAADLSKIGFLGWLAPLPFYLESWVALAPLAALTGLVFVAIGVAGAAWPLVSYCLPLPRWGLAGAALAWWLLHPLGFLATAFGFDGAAALSLLLLGAALAYLASALRRLTPRLRPRLREAFGAGTRWPEALAWAAFVWELAGQTLAMAAGLAALRPLADLLTPAEGPTSPLAALLPARGWLLALGVVLLVGNQFARQREPASLRPYRLPLTLAGLALLAGGSWLMGQELAALGWGAPLLGAMLATGFGALALAQVVAAAWQEANPPWRGAVAWLRRSWLRVFLLGAALACYGLYLRPALYQTLAFAPLFEWLAVCALALTILALAGRQATAALATAPLEQLWLDWGRHRQHILALPDAHFTDLTDLVARFEASGDSADLWVYNLGVLLNNQVSPLALAPALESLARHQDSPPGWLPWPGKLAANQRRWRRERRTALDESLRRIKETLAQPGSGNGAAIDEALREAGEAFIRRRRADQFAALLAAAAVWRGADWRDAGLAWRWLLRYADDPIPWWLLPFMRRGRRLRNRAVRQRLTAAAIERVMGAGQPPLRQVALVAEDIALSQPRNAQGQELRSYELEAGWPVEILGGGASSGVYQARTVTGVTGYLPTWAVYRPRMPG